MRLLSSEHFITSIFSLLAAPQRSCFHNFAMEIYGCSSITFYVYVAPQSFTATWAKGHALSHETYLAMHPH
eukprot:8630877-Karenia_brevis.AAC.1